MDEQELRTTMRDFLQRLLDCGYGKTNLTSLPGEFDILWAELKDCDDEDCGKCAACEDRLEALQGQEPDLNATSAAERQEMQAKIQRDLK